MSDVQLMSCRRFAAVWYCECEVTPDGPRHVHLWEPLDVDVPADARPCSYGVGEIDFYDRSGNKLLVRKARHHNLSSIGGEVVLLPGGRFYEVVSGRCVYRDGRWWMRWWAGDNTRLARMMNAGYTEYCT